MTKSTVSPAGMRILKLLVGSPPKSVADLIEDTGVTRTAVTEQLNELVVAGLVEKETERLTGRGRPRHVYTATEDAILMFYGVTRNPVVPVIWDVLRNEGGEQLLDKVSRKVSEALAARYTNRISGSTPEDRLREFCEILRTPKTTKKSRSTSDLARSSGCTKTRESSVTSTRR
jgi:predicted ArsR family transcriptional regulator